ncbi:hypothetical protein F2Q70_00010837 [Brassica cretica]|uniref:Uncharacterized protein n=1 Tax=Brassica cretica TaxID=69181 RepID=A0A8S9M016_BRACR|nr:hypothetical protein F2Q68_00003935 [Brassica cretica]KAF2610796.1 hypothetical protein F2Q70_00010837 [Brassica cretica]
MAPQQLLSIPADTPSSTIPLRLMKNLTILSVQDLSSNAAFQHSIRFPKGAGMVGSHRCGEEIS